MASSCVRSGPCRGTGSGRRTRSRGAHGWAPGELGAAITCWVFGLLIVAAFIAAMILLAR